MFLIVSTGYNCEKYVQKCYESIISQTYKNFKAIIINDGSTDNTEVKLSEIHTDKRIEIYSAPLNRGASLRRWQAIKAFPYFNEETIIVLLGLDDQLLPNALEKIKEQYDLGKWMTYGNWIAQDGYKLPEGFLNFSKEIHEKRDYRKDTYRATAPNTFKKFLFDKLTEEDFKVKGEWVKATTESNLMLSCLEMCGENRIGIIQEPIYLYNKGRSDNARKRFGDSYQDGIYQDVINREKKDLI